MAALSKRMASLTEKVTGKDPVSVTEAVELLKSFGALKFDQSVEIAMRLGVDPKQADQIVRGSISNLALSPGMHISTSPKRFAAPVTSVVLK